MTGHRVQLSWMGQMIWTLDDLLRPGLIAVCVGINPAPVSVSVGHYYQGLLGQRLFGRFGRVGLLPITTDDWEDDAAFAVGLGFTDIVKRPTRKAAMIAQDEYEYGRERLAPKLADANPALVIFSFKEAAVKLFGDFEGNGFVPGLRIGSSVVFVMPGPMEARQTADRTLATMKSAIAGLRAKARSQP